MSDIECGCSGKCPKCYVYTPNFALEQLCKEGDVLGILSIITFILEKHKKSDGCFPGACVEVDGLGTFELKSGASLDELKAYALNLYIQVTWATPSHAKAELAELGL